MSLKVYNTLTKTKELFDPVVPGQVGIYLCGPTVYKPSHIGHVVGPIIFDAIKRYLVHKGYKVKFVINITDVDDKLIDAAAKQNVKMSDLAESVTRGYMQALEALAVRSVDAFPRATEHIDKIISLVSRLIERGAAYAVDGDVYFDHTKAADYGKLSGQRPDETMTGTRDVASKSRHPADFVLWKTSKPGEPAWNSPWGPGRPGWHIECSAMSMALLGETFDIHGGGIDLVFPHHENEIAQSETATGKTYAKYWLHNGLTRIRTKTAGGDWQNEKMSKSLGNIRQISDLLEQYNGETLRAFVLSTHYRSPIDFSDEQIANTIRAMKTFYRLFERIERLTEQNVYKSGETSDRLSDVVDRESDKQFVETVIQHRIRLYEAMDDDFNTAEAIAALHDLAGAINRYIDQVKLETRPDELSARLVAAAGRSLVGYGRLLGLFETPPTPAGSDGLGKQLMGVLIELRTQARKDKNFALADRIRDRLAEIDITIEDTPGGAVWRKD